MIDLTRIIDDLSGKPVAVFGLARSGLASVKALHEVGVHVIAWDDNEVARQLARDAGAEIKDLTQINLSGAACLILAPGVPLDFPSKHPVVAAARKAGIEIICDIELFYRSDQGAKSIAVTGTNGKSTTVSLIDHVLKTCGRASALGGNIGTPVLELDTPPGDGAFVLELSSFQLDLCDKFTSDISVLLNITPDHLDRHGTMENYIAAKEKMFGATESVDIICVDDEFSQALFERVKVKKQRGNVIPVSVTKVLERGVYVRNGILIDSTGEEPITVGDLRDLTKLSGVHNHQNIAAAYTTLRVFGLESAEILDGMKTYPGLAHRQFLTRKIGPVSYINDSKATNAPAAQTALSAYENIYWIVGGLGKDGGLKGLEGLMNKVRHAYVIGDAAQDFSKWLSENDVAVTNSGTLENAVARAHSDAQSNTVEAAVLLSPACASYDQFKSFEERGDCFSSLVKELSQEGKQGQ